MLEENVPNPLAKNPNFHTHKVFAAIGIILIVSIIVIGGVWYFVQSAEDKVGKNDETNVDKSPTSSAKQKTATISNNPENTRDSKRRSDLKYLKTAMQLFYYDCKVYPPSIPTTTFTDKSFTNLNCENSGTIYMKDVPLDPKGSTYGYLASPHNCSNACENYTIGAVLENPNIDDKQTLIKCSETVKMQNGEISNYRVCNG